MGRCIIFFCSLIMLLILTSFRFKSTESKVEVPETLKVTEPTLVLYPNNRTSMNLIMVAPPYLGSSFVAFKEALAFKESRGDYFTTNTLGYLGKYQFGISTLELMGVRNSTHFLSNPVLQEKAFKTNVSRNKWILRKDIERFEGMHIKGIEVTESGILAAAHLAGAGNVKKYLRSWGEEDVTDEYGTSISKYLRKFSGYDLSAIAPKKNPKI